MRVYFIRHGQSTNNARTNSAEPRDIDAMLTTTGRRQAGVVAEYLAQATDIYPISPEAIANERQQTGYGITQVYCSPMWRALQTAEPIGEALGVAVEVWDDIHEHGGIYVQEDDQVVGLPGKTRQEFLAAFPRAILPDTITDTGWWNRDFETWDDAYERAKPVVRRLRKMARTTDEAIAIVAHQLFLDTLLKSLLSIPPRSNHYFNHYNVGISRLDFEPGDLVFIRYLNHTGHLPPDCITT